MAGSPNRNSDESTISWLLADAYINGMALGYASHFRVADPRIHGIADYLLRVEMPDFVWNCEHVHGAAHS